MHDLASYPQAPFHLSSCFNLALTWLVNRLVKFYPQSKTQKCTTKEVSIKMKFYLSSFNYDFHTKD